MSDVTKNVRQRDGDRGQRGDTEDSGQFVERVVDIYESVDDIISGPQEDMRDNTAGRHTQRRCSKAVRRPCRVCLGMLCLSLLAVNIGLVVHYNSVNNNLTLERNQLQREVNQLKREKAVKSCPSGWKKFGCSCYYRSTDRKTWEKSRAECLNEGADLVIINNKQEQEFVKGFNQDHWSRWIGLNRTGVNWTWVDGSPLTIEYWESGWPLNTEELRNCTYYNPDGKWYNDVCSYKRGRICEK